MATIESLSYEIFGLFVLNLNLSSRFMIVDQRNNKGSLDLEDKVEVKEGDLMQSCALPSLPTSCSTVVAVPCSATARA